MASELPPPGTAASEVAWHGLLGCGRAWPAPRLLADSAEEARPGFSSCSAEEYEDLPEVLAAKAGLLAQLLRQSRHTVAYTGAGISTGAGIKDYASKAAASKVLELVARSGGEKEDEGEFSGLAAEPTTSHRIFAALHRSSLLAHWIQQNHDGLPQKADCPQSLLNEIHGSWFDPANTVVHFRAELRPDLFAWLLDEELRADLVIAVGTSLCDTPSTADRVVVSAASRAQEEPGTALGSVVVGLQRTRLDQHVQLRIFGLADHFFGLVASELWGLVAAEAWAKGLQELAPSAVDTPPSEDVEALLGDSAELSDGQLVYVAAGPMAGRAARIAGKKCGEHFELDCGNLLGSWWLSASKHAAAFPLSSSPVKRPARYMRVIEAARMIEVPVRPGTAAPVEFLSGTWSGDAVLMGDARADHPTASPDRAQHLRWVLGPCDESNGPESAEADGAHEFIGAGFTSWPAAHVILGTRGRVWHVMRGAYYAEAGMFQLDMAWEPVPGSRVAADGLGPEQGEAVWQHVKVNGRVWWDDRRGAMALAGMWTDGEGVSGALLMVQDPAEPFGWSVPGESQARRQTCCAGAWGCDSGGSSEDWVLSVDTEGLPGLFGAASTSATEKSGPNLGLSLLRGVTATTCGPGQDANSAPFRVNLRRDGFGDIKAEQLELECCIDGCGRGTLRKVGGDEPGTESFCRALRQPYVPVQLSDILGRYGHSRGGEVELSEDQGKVVIRSSQVKGATSAAASTACIQGHVRLHKQLGRRRTCGRLDWSNGSVWTPVE